MSRNFETLFREATQLPDCDRATLAGLLIETLGSAAEPDVEAAWSAEIGRRVEQVDNGTVKTIPWNDVRDESFGRR